MNESPWISVKESLISIEKRAFKIAVRYPNNSIVVLCPSDRIDSAITHWMPIPELPKVDPFEKWWEGTTQSGKSGVSLNDSFKVISRLAWNAALEHAKAKQ